ncbi:dihydroxyacetone kinase subunit DhaL [Sphingobium nicotianae]|uniref:Dihydroxyacetone kinase subunit L n=1 Tax=Sphingobium nicotianae TaxID=2782607 RepID=A0A9X1DFJ4_9SPHN|nr:dihydroxyacetone kinase subunit DhaL [Sphingobium nicotianae]MBT2189101.1 dihydroxyacetone kinase subunit L [Sphingobium nicotianae]
MTTTQDATQATALAILDALCARLIEAEAELNALDRAVGDGDHGHNLARAANALLAIRDELAPLSVPEMLKRAGKAVVMSVGGASGPLYGTLLLEQGKGLPEGEASRADWARAFTLAVEGVARRGKSAEGEKTMLDVLGPAARAFEGAVDQDFASALAALSQAAVDGHLHCRGLHASRGRAAYVGERSVGQDDPGATTAMICVQLVAAKLAEGAA